MSKLSCSGVIKSKSLRVGLNRVRGGGTVEGLDDIASVKCAIVAGGGDGGFVDGNDSSDIGAGRCHEAGICILAILAARTLSVPIP